MIQQDKLNMMIKIEIQIHQFRFMSILIPLWEELCGSDTSSNTTRVRSWAAIVQPHLPIRKMET